LKDAEEALNAIKTTLNSSKKKLIESENQKRNALDEHMSIKQDLEVIMNEYEFFSSLVRFGVKFKIHFKFMKNKDKRK